MSAESLRVSTARAIEATYRGLFLLSAAIALLLAGCGGASARGGNDGQNRNYTLNHRLSQGPSLQITVDATKKLRRTNKKVLGVSFFLPGDGPVASWDGAYRSGLPIDRDGNYRLNDYPTGNFEPLIRDLRLEMTRLYDLARYDRWASAGVADQLWYMQFDAQTALDRWHDLLLRLGIPEENVAISMMLYTAPGNGTILPAPEFWQQMVQYSRNQGYHFKRWEIGNEVYLPPQEESETHFKLNGHNEAVDFETRVGTFVSYFKQVSQAIRSVQPEAQIGISINGSEKSTQQGTWGRRVLEDTAGFYDFIVGHYYAFGCQELADNAFENFVLAHNYALLQNQLDDLQFASQQPANRYRNIYHYDTEWGAHATREPWDGQQCGNVSAEVRNGNLYGTLHRAVRLIYYLRENICEGASTWVMFQRNPENQPAFGLLTHNDATLQSITYWLYYYFTRYTGDWVLDMEGTAPYLRTTYTHWPWGSLYIEGPYTPVLASITSDGRLMYIIIANGSDRIQHGFRFNLVNFVAHQADGFLLNDYRPGTGTDAWKNNAPFSRDPRDFVRQHQVTLSPDGTTLQGDLPPHSVLFISVTRR